MTNLEKNKVSRRDALKLIGVGGAGLLIGATGIEAATEKVSNFFSPSKADASEILPFYGEYQQGIITPAQDFMYLASFNLETSSKAEVRNLFKKWTEASSLMSKGKDLGDSEPQSSPPIDTGEAVGLQPMKLSFTFGVGPNFFEKLSIQSKKPSQLKDLPHFSGDDLREEWNGGDIVVQVCANDQQVAFHGLRNLIRIGRGTVSLKWMQHGFQRSTNADPTGSTPRNLMGFKDGTGNPDTKDKNEMNNHIWIQNGDGPAWMSGGSYLVARRIRIRVEEWDRSTLGDQEQTFGRHRGSGAPLGDKDEFAKLDIKKKDDNGKLLIPADSHVALAKGNGKIKILRRSYSYTDGLDLQTGKLDAGLLFVSFQRDLEKQFIPLQDKLAKMDLLNEYIEHNGSAVFVCFPGVKEGSFIGEGLI
ncbi:iron uptake transporter deferrochelatase/peroxidase subunit [Bacillus sp. EAC]|uniref:iron uptake transporter deferrochelatase/peroxidase subunit n=1 Tax=Bacillus sp. EAC TaxID=1978338 RepID=UPI000B434495|nr:iron uptake transporter deferrochelatase/peroxidase subunit [Bacillus sp. EAC]